MGKYLHRYLDLDEFKGDYSLTGPITAITISGGGVFTECNNWNTTAQTNDYDGKYVFDREIENPDITSCGGAQSPYEKMRVYRKGDVEINDYYGDFLPDGSGGWVSEMFGEVNLIHDLTSAYAVGDCILQVSDIERGTPVYEEPWVSYTTYSAATQVSGDWWFAREDGLVNKKKGTAVLKYVGEVDWEGTLC